MRDFPIIDFGARADGTSDDAAAIQEAVNAAHASGGGRVVIPSGSCVRAGSFELKSRIDFHVAEGAVLVSATGIEAFPRRVFGSGEETDKRLWIGARHASDITLSGRGTIDGQCRAFALGETDDLCTPNLPWRPAMTCFEDICGLRIRDLTFRNSANWTLHFTGCRDVHVHDITILNDWKFPNADGIDPDHCQRVKIERCRIVSADDGIVLKNTAQFAAYGPCEDVEILDCHIRSRSAAIKIGSESHGDFRRIRVGDCVIEGSNRGLAIQLRDTGSVEDVEFSRIRIQTRPEVPEFWGAAEPVSITALARSPGTSPGSICNVRFRDLACDSANGIVIYGDPPGRIRELLFERVRLELSGTGGGILDLRPFSGGHRPEGRASVSEETPWGHLVRCDPTACFIQGAADVIFREVTCQIPNEAATSWQLLHCHPPLTPPPRILSDH